LIYGKDLSSGRYLLITDRAMSQVLHVLDFAQYLQSPRGLPQDREFITQHITWVARQGEVLYVSHGHSTYAKSSMGDNAYITALSLRDYHILWSSRPLVANARNFVIAREVILTGYGFTQEPDFLYGLDRHTGRVVLKQKVKSGPDYLVLQDDLLHMRTYDMAYVFGLR
jgi:hypothetical protein